MRQLSASVLALALGLAAATALVSCGGGNDADLLPGETASEINASLDMVRDLADSGDCAGAQDAARQVSDQIDALTGIDRKLKQTLLDAAARLNEVVADCVETTTEAIAPTIPDTTEQTTPEPKRREAQPREDRTTTTTTTAPTTPTTPTTTTPTTPTTPVPEPPVDGGGTGAPGGVSPGSAAGGQ